MKTFRTATATAVMLAAMACASGASAGVYSDDLTKCLVRSASPADNNAFMRWLFVTLSQSAVAKEMSTVTPQQLQSANKDAAVLMQRLITQDCRAESIAALKYEGSGAFQSSFEVFGKVAAQGLFSDPAVTAGMSDFEQYFDDSKFDALAKEAGVPTR